MANSELRTLVLSKSWGHKPFESARAHALDAPFSCALDIPVHVLAIIIQNAFIFKNGNRRYKYLVLGHEETYYVKKHSGSKKK